jgi:choline dehydrogenase-like flavoprotein
LPRRPTPTRRSPSAATPRAAGSSPGTHPGSLDRYYYGRRPAGFYLPRYVNLTERGATDFVRGFGFQGYSYRSSWDRGVNEPGVGAELKQRLRYPGRWEMTLIGFGEMLPRPDNRVTLSERTDRWGIPLLHIDCTHGENERRIAERASRDAAAMLAASGYENIRSNGPIRAPGDAVHEMGTARMGLDPATSVLNRYNQAHDVPNLFITDGSCMTSSSCVNPSLTYMALSARAAHYAADRIRSGEL